MIAGNSFDKDIGPASSIKIFMRPESLAHGDPLQRKQSYLDSAVGAFSAGRMREAYKNLSHANALDPSDAQVLYLLSETCIRTHANALAMRYATSALALDPNLVAALPVQIEASIRNDNLDQARSLLVQYPSTNQHSLMHKLLTHRLSSAEEHFEVTLAELSELIEGDDKLVLARELFAFCFKKFSEANPTNRYREFIDAVGLDFSKQILTLQGRVWSDPEQGSIDIIIPVHNALQHLSNCLASLRRFPDPALRQIILVDDASDDTTKSWLDRYVAETPGTVLIRNRKNLGFTRSIIAGLSHSNAPFFVMLNSDTVVSLGWMAGLWRGLAADERHAMAGPLSNNAYFQSVAQITQLKGLIELDETTAIDRTAAFLRASGLAAYPRVPFLSGFCLMIRRDFYDAVGGLDGISYPFGYFEVQDLALRLIDCGQFPCLVDNVYVHHFHSGSIEVDKRNTLVSEGFRNICARHGAIRVLAAEEICRNLPDLARQSKAIQAFFGKPPASQSLGHSDGPPASRWLISPREGMISNSDDVCLFVSHSPFGQISEMTSHYLSELRDAGLQIVVCLAVDDLDIPIQSDWIVKADAVLIRENAGFDFGAWADLLRKHPDLWFANRLLFANDSVVGPLTALSPLIKRIRLENAGFFALTDCTVHEYHAESYFFGWAGLNLADNGLRDFWERIENLADKQCVIQRYEIPLLALCETLPDQSRQILFGLHDIFGPAAGMIPLFRPVHSAWAALATAGNPFVKTAVLRSDSSAIAQLSAMIGADEAMLRRHVEQSKFNRD